MKKKYVAVLFAACMMAATSVMGVSAATQGTTQTAVTDVARGGTPGQFGGFGGGFGGGAMNQSNVEYASEAGEVVISEVANTASDLTADEKNADTFVMSNTDSQVKIDTAGTYIVTGSCSDGNITVKKGTTGVVLILKDLDLTSKTGAAVSCNKGSEVKIIVEGEVTLTDAENPEDEDSADTAVADAFDGAALKIKDGANVYLTGDGTLNIDASSCKNGIKVGDADSPSFVIDGDLTVNIDAANDAINAGYDLTILSGIINITAEDDAIHADRILTIGSEDGNGPVINIEKCGEGLEGTVVNLFGGSAELNTTDDAVNAANKESLYADEMDFSINITGGEWNIKSSGDGLDSNGNINLIGGSVSISSSTGAGEAGIDYDGAYYVSDDVELDNQSGVSGPDMMGGRMMNGGMMNGGLTNDSMTNGNAGGNMRGGRQGLQNGQADSFGNTQSGTQDSQNKTSEGAVQTQPRQDAPHGTPQQGQQLPQGQQPPQGMPQKGQQPSQGAPQQGNTPQMQQMPQMPQGRGGRR